MRQDARQGGRLNGGMGSGQIPARSAGRPRALTLVLFLLILLAVMVGEARAESFAEEEVRAVYLYNFAVFVEWPVAAFESSSSPLRYCALGSEALRASLADVLSGERVGERALTLVDAETPAAWRRCHVLYLGHAAQPRLEQVLTAVEGAPVLTVGESESFARAGGMVGLARRAGHLRTTINREAAEAVGIHISSKLLRLATLVSSRQGGNPP